MPAIQKQRPFSPEQLLAAIDQLDTTELRPFVSQVVARAAHRMAPSLPAREAKLLQLINQGLPSELDHRCRELNGRRRSDSLDPSEREELLRLTDEVERLQAERVRHLIQLAEIRGVALPKLMDDLGIEPPPVE